jgi:exodeoxyribonuclease VIII
MPDVANPEPGVYPDVPEGIYFQIDAINGSTLKQIRKSPAHARAAQLSPSKETPAQRLGTMIHLAILQPDKFKATTVPPLMDPETGKPMYRRSKDQKAKHAQYEEEHKGKTIIDNADWHFCMRMHKAVWDVPEYAKLLSTPGANEVVVIWVDPATGLKCKCRVDRLTTLADGRTAIIDLKTTKDAGDWSFGKDCHTYGYHISAAHYVDGVNIAVPSDAERIHLILAAEKVAPFGSRLLRLDQVSIEQGRNDLEKWMRTWADCVEANYYPNYDPAITEIRIPSYAIKIEDWEAPE